MLASMTEKSGDITEVKNYIDLLDNSQAMNGVGCDVKIQDFAVSALEQQTGVKASKSNQSIKAILSCYKNEQVYRYHILELNQTDIQKYKYKVSKWLMTQLAN